MIEVWKSIEGYNGDYAISSLGRVKNTKRDYILKNVKHHSGYLVVNLRGKVHSMHTLVAKTFIPNPDELATVNHKDKNKENNCVANLEWMSNADNITHGQGKKVAQVFNGVVVRIFNSSEEAARELSINGSLIRACCRREPGRLTYKGYEWRYV